MSSLRVRLMLWLLAGVLTVSGVGLSIWTVRRMDASRVTLAQKIRDLGELRRLAAEVRQFHDARRLVEELANRRPVSLESLAGGTGLKFKVRVISDALPSVAGWEVRQKELDLTENELFPAQVMELVAYVENGGRTNAPTAAPDSPPAAPPWRLVRCNLKASAKTPGSVDTILVFEALEKTDGR